MASLKSRIIRFFYLRRGVIKRLLPKSLVFPVKGPGFRLLVSADDWAVGARIAIKGAYEVHGTREVSRALAPGQTFIDVGANIGWYSMLAASRVGSEGKVLAFEPGVSNGETLLRSARLNGFTTIKLHPVAVSDAPGLVGYYADDSNGWVSKDLAAPGSTPVKAIRLDDALKDEPRVDLIKMDIEGGEGRALAGMQETLRRHRPTLFLEFSAGALRSVSAMEPTDVLGALRSLGYEIWVNPSRGRVASHPQSDQEIMAALPGDGAAGTARL